MCAVEDIGGRTVLFSVHDDDHLRRWNPATGEQIGTPTRTRRRASTLCEVTDAEGPRLLATSGSGGLQLWDAAAGQPVGELLENTENFRGMVICPVPAVDGHTLIAVVIDRATIRLYDPRTRRQVGMDMQLTSELDSNWVDTMCTVLAPDGRTLLATGGSDGLVWLWDPTTCQPVAEPLHAHDTVTDMCVLPAPDGPQLVTIGGDGLLRLWNPHTREPICQPLRGHTDNWLTAVCAVPGVNGRTLIATGGHDRAILLWEPAEPPSRASLG